jgi:hypothetical protein
MRLLPASPRARRRAAWVSAVVAVAAAVAALVVVLPDRSSSIPKERISTEPVVVASTPRTVRLPRAERDAIDRTLATFVRDAVRRKDVRAAYDLAAPEMRAGQSRAEWAKGGIPVMPYPGQTPGSRAWTLNYSYPGDVGLDLLLQPLPTAKVGPISFRVEVKKIRGTWRIASFYPVASFAPVGKQARVQAEPDLAPTQPTSPDRGRLGAWWLLGPGLALLGLLVATPIALAVLGWRRRVRAERAYQEFVAERGG